jgi:hypothetical protein
LTRSIRILSDDLRAPAEWLAFVLACAGLIALIAWTDRPPAPAGAGVAPTEFSEARAMPVVEHLAGTIGYRINGQPGAHQAARYLLDTLRGVAGLELEVQEHVGAMRDPWGSTTIVYSVQNVLIRLPGERRDAILVSTHYDSPPESVGAADAALCTAAIVEMARALAAGPRLRNTIVFNLNGGEEAGYLGAAAFLEHPWLEDVRAFVNLEAAGAGGKSILFQVSEGHDWLLEVYAGSAPHPYGTSIAQDVFRSGLIPSDTDYVVYNGLAGLPGLDIALYQDGYVYHTQLDRLARIERGSLQHMGVNTLAVVRALARIDLSAPERAPSTVFYDLLGVVMFTHSRIEAGVLALGGAALAALVLGLVLRRGVLRLRDLLASAMIACCAAAAGLLAALLAAAVLAYGLGAPHRWFGAPWLAVACFAPIAISGHLAVQSAGERWLIRDRVPASARIQMRWAGALVLWNLLAIALTWTGLGACYVALWWALPGALGLLLVSLRPSWRLVAMLTLLPGAALSLQAGHQLLQAFAPVSGRFSLPFPFDLIIAFLVAVPAAGLATAATATLAPGGRLARVALVWAAVGVAALGVAALRWPYTPERPKRMYIEVRDEDERARLYFADKDYLDARIALDDYAGDIQPSPAPLTSWTDESYVLELPPLGLEAPQIAVGERQPADGADLVELAIHPGGYRLIHIDIPRDALVGWSLDVPLPELRDDETSYGLRIIAPPRGGYRLTLRLRSGVRPVLRYRAEYGRAIPAHVSEVLRELPAWADADVAAVKLGTIEP